MSGIDTKSIVSQLMAIERLPQNALRQRITSLNSVTSTWNLISTKVNDLKNAASALSGLGAAEKMMKVTSSDESAISVRANGSPGAAASANIKVINTATAHSVAGSDVFSTADADLGGRTLRLTVGGVNHDITPAGSGIDDLAAAVNEAGLGIRAAVIKVGTDQYQLQMTSNATGAAAQFTASGGGWGSFTATKTGADAKLDVDGLIVKRPTNVVTDLIDGVELTLKAPSTGDVRIDVARDTEALTTKIKALVTAANAAVEQVKAASRTSSSGSGTAGPLAGNSTARSIINDIRGVVAAAIGGADGLDHPPSELGVSLTREGTIKFDEAKLQKTLTETPEVVYAALGKGARSDNVGVKVTSLLSTATAGTDSVRVTRAATKATLSGTVEPLAAPGSTVTLEVTQGTNAAKTVTFTAGADGAASAVELTKALKAAGISAEASFSGGAFTLTSTMYGSRGNLSVTDDVTNPTGLSGTAAGLDVAADVNGTAVTGSGQSLTADGVVYAITLEAVQLGGGPVTATVTTTNGLAGTFESIASRITKTDGGVIRAATDAVALRVKDLQGRVDRYDDILARKEEVLVRRFAGVESLISQMGSSLSSLGGLTNFSYGSQ